MDYSSEPATLLLRGILALGRRVRAERPPGALSLSGLGILGSLNRIGPIPASRLAVEERLQPQSLTRLLADLEQRHLILRQRSKVDRRAVIIGITAAGRTALFEDIAARRVWLEAALNKQLTGRERETLHAAGAIMIRLAAHQPVLE